MNETPCAVSVEQSLWKALQIEITQSLVVSAELCKMLQGISDPNCQTKSNPKADLLNLSAALRTLGETHFTWDFLPHPQCLPFVEHHEKLPSTTNPTVQIRAAEET